jgi:DUF971 family protein
MPPEAVESPERIEVEARRWLRLRWRGGMETSLSAEQLRQACACADCRSTRERRRLRLVAIDPEPPTIEGANLVGAYGLKLVFGPDGHRTGIFTWSQLWELAGRQDTSR